VREFTSGVKDVFVATDIAAKGLDFPSIRHIINYDMPHEVRPFFSVIIKIENYVHRIGRTGR